MDYQTLMSTQFGRAIKAGEARGLTFVFASQNPIHLSTPLGRSTGWRVGQFPKFTRKSSGEYVDTGRCTFRHLGESYWAVGGFDSSDMGSILIMSDTQVG